MLFIKWIAPFRRVSKRCFARDYDDYFNGSDGARRSAVISLSDLRLRQQQLIGGGKMAAGAGQLRREFRVMSLIHASQTRSCVMSVIYLYVVRSRKCLKRQIYSCNRHFRVVEFE